MDTTTAKGYGLCACGCKQKTKIAKRTDKVHGRVKGEPNRFIQGHQGRKPGEDYVTGSNPYGICACGCGTITPISAKTRSVYGHVKGKPVRFILGHQFRSKKPEWIVDQATGCWNWNRYRDRDGYGSTRTDGSLLLAHRAVYERLVGPIPEGLELDHLCFNTSCVNPAHLEPVTGAENLRREQSHRKQLKAAKAASPPELLAA